MKKLNKKGFTLVELLAVIVILALLMVVATRTIGGSLSKSKEAAIKTEANKLIGKTSEDIQSYLLSPTGYPNFTYDSSVNIGDKINKATAQSIELKDGDYHMTIDVAANSSSLGNICIDDGESLKYTGTLKDGNSLDTFTKATGTWSACS